LFAHFSVWCFVVPPVVGAVALVVRLIERRKAVT
jgi:hypothetical protein